LAIRHQLDADGYGSGSQKAIKGDSVQVHPIAIGVKE
jgi:hypothetical protein